MKFTKLLMVFASSAALFSMAGCNKNGTAAGRQRAVESVAKSALIWNYKSNTELYTKDTGFGNALDNAPLSSLKSYPYTDPQDKHEYTVELNWNYDRAKYGDPAYKNTDKEHKSKFVNKWMEPDSKDDARYYTQFYFSTTKDVEFEFYVDVTCGDATKRVEYSVKLLQLLVNYTDKTLEEVYTTSEDGSYYTTWQTEKHGSLYKDDTKHLRTKGQAVYVAPDNNFGIMGDGERFIYLYKLNESGFDIEVGKYYQIAGRMGDYKGSVQMSFLSWCEELEEEEHAEVTPAATHLEVTANNLKKYVDEETTPTAFHHTSDKHVRLAQITCKFSKATNFKDGSRGTTTIKDAEGNDFRVAYDYHTAIYKELNEKTASVVNKTVVMKGFIIYNTSSSDTWNPLECGSWDFTPYDANLITVVG